MYKQDCLPAVTALNEFLFYLLVPMPELNRSYTRPDLSPVRIWTT